MNDEKPLNDNTMLELDLLKGIKEIEDDKLCSWDDLYKESIEYIRENILHE